MWYTFRMFPRALFCALSIGVLSVVSTGLLPGPKVAVNASEPGWNSWDAYGLTIDEKDYRANTAVLAGLKQYGWEYWSSTKAGIWKTPSPSSVVAHRFTE